MSTGDFSMYILDETRSQIDYTVRWSSALFDSVKPARAELPDWMVGF